MSDARTVRVSILDKEYQVSCAADEVAALQNSAHFLDQKMREMKDHSSVIGLDRLAVMAALNLTNELLAQSEKASELDSDKAKIANQLGSQQAEIASLNEKLDSALNRLKPKINKA
jgi:cell division protein ZapA